MATKIITLVLIAVAILLVGAVRKIHIQEQLINELTTENKEKDLVIDQLRAYYDFAR